MAEERVQDDEGRVGNVGRNGQVRGELLLEAGDLRTLLPEQGVVVQVRIQGHVPAKKTRTHACMLFRSDQDVDLAPEFVVPVAGDGDEDVPWQEDDQADEVDDPEDGVVPGGDASRVF